MVVNFTLTDIDQAAIKFIDAIKQNKVVAFHGEMGAGKTTFINAVCRLLQVKDMISSPTFSIINEYTTSNERVVFHIDLYRLKDEAEAIAAGVEECIQSNSYCFVEWPEKAIGIFPPDTLHCYLTSTGNNERKLLINL